MPLFMLLSALPFTAGCGTVGSERYGAMTRDKLSVEEENAELKASVAAQNEWKERVARFESRIRDLEAVNSPLVALCEKKEDFARPKAMQATAASGGGSEIPAVVRRCYAELDKRATETAKNISTAFDAEDPAATHLFSRLEDRILDESLELADLTLRAARQAAADRNLVMARLKALEECFTALRSLGANESVSLSHRQQRDLVETEDLVRIEYAGTLRSDCFPAIPHFIPIAIGEECLEALELMNTHLRTAGTLYASREAEKSEGIHADLQKDIVCKNELLIQGAPAQTKAASEKAAIQPATPVKADAAPAEAE